MDFGTIIARARAILTTPKTEWPVVAAEPATVQGLYTNYILILAALPAIAGFIKNSLIGFSLLGATVRTPVGSGLAGMVLQYLLSLALVYVMALIVNALAPSFEGQKDAVQALKTVAYAWTASWVAGIAVILPWIGWLIALAGGIYAIYLLYLGLPSTMKCPPEKTAGYTAVTVLIGIVLSWIIGLVVAGVIGTAALTGAAVTGSRVTMTGGDGTVTVDKDSPMGKLAAMGERAEQASKDLEAARQSGDVAAQRAAMGKMMGNDGNVQSLPADQIKGFLPEKVAGLKRESFSAERSGAGVQVTVARGQYADGDQRIELEISDTGSMKGMMAMATSFAPEAERQTDTGYEKTYSENGRLVHESWDKTSKSGEYSVIVGQRFSVKASGQAKDMDQLKDAVDSVDLGKLESLKNEGVASH